MAQVTVTIAGRIYRMACGDGEEPHLQSLARMVDGKIEDLRKNFGEIGDQRITVMAALTVADELSEMKRRMAQLEVDLVNLRRERSSAEESREALATAITESLGEAALRIERVAQVLNGAAKG